MVDHWWLFSSEGAHGEDCQGGELPSPAGDIRCWSEAEPVLVVTTRDHIHDKLRGCGVDMVHLTHTPWGAGAVCDMILSARGGQQLLGGAGVSQG